MTARLVFGEADPRAYEEPRCACGHYNDGHYDGQGTPATGEEGPGEAPCWDGWTGDEEGCECDKWAPEKRP